jgi:hypothetical protein
METDRAGRGCIWAAARVSVSIGRRSQVIPAQAGTQGRDADRAAYTYNGKAYTASHEIACDVRDFNWIAERRLLFVNQALHEASVFQYNETGFTAAGAVRTEAPMGMMAVSHSLEYLASSCQHSGDVEVYAIRHDEQCSARRTAGRLRWQRLHSAPLLRRGRRDRSPGAGRRRHGDA